MKKWLFFFLLAHTNLFALSQEEPSPFFERNYIQIDPVYLDYKNIKADNNDYSEDNKQFISSRPSILFYFNIDDYVLRPFISIEPTISSYSNKGSFSIGKLFSQTFDAGLYMLLNHAEDLTGSGSKQQGNIYSQFILGPYLAYYPYFTNKQYLQIYTRFGYLYSENKTIINGSTNNKSEQEGIHLNIGICYSTKLSHYIYYAPGINVTYSATSDLGAQNTIRSGFEWQITPISLQVPF